MMRVMVLMAVLMLAGGSQQMHGQRGVQPQDQASTHQLERKQLTQGAQAPMPGRDITGNWQGTLQLERSSLRTIVKITENDGKYEAAFCSIDQGGQPIAVTSISLAGATLNFAVAPLDLTYRGKLNQAGNTILGSVTQHGQTYVLDLDHVTAEDTWTIPEPPPRAPPADAHTLVFEVATIKPAQGIGHGTISFEADGLRISNMPLFPLVSIAYGHLQLNQIVGLPNWAKDKVFDIETKVAAADVPQYRKLDFHRDELMLRPILEDRFRLKAHFETREGSIYELVIADSGAKLKGSDPSELTQKTPRRNGMSASAVLISDLAEDLGAITGKTVLDHTGLKGKYDFALYWSSEPILSMPSGDGLATSPADSGLPSIFTAVQEQLGLKLRPMKGPTEVLVIDNIEPPSEN
jgi:uncharacterized protein (TIGR03435 family)